MGRLTSIHGNKVGLTHEGNLAAKGFESGLEEGRRIAMPGPYTVALFDDFLGDVIADQWNYVEGTDSATADAAVLAGGIGGVLRMTTGDAGTGLAADQAQLTSYLNWQASNGGLVMQARVKLSRITDAYAFIGFTDLTTLEAPIISAGSADTLTTNASDAVGFMFDTRMTTDNWWLTGVAANTDATAQDMDAAPVADDYATFRVEVDDEGTAQFFYNGVRVGGRMTGAVTPGTDLTPTIVVGNLTGVASFTADVDYIHVAMDRAVDGAAV